MAKISVPYLTTRPGSNGRQRHFWQPNKKLRELGFVLKRLSDDPGLAAQEAQGENRRVAAAIEAAKAGGQLVVQPRHGIDPNSIEALVRAYAGTEADAKGKRIAGSPEFEDLAEKTKVEYRRHLKALVGWAGDKDKRAIDAQLARKWYETLKATGAIIRDDKGKEIGRKERPVMALAIIRTACILFYWDRLHGRKPSAEDVVRNPFARLDLDHTPVDDRDPETLLWPTEAVTAYIAKADALGVASIGTAILINSWFGQRLNDLVRIPRTVLQPGGFKLKQSKRGRWVVLPAAIVPAVQERITWQMAELQRREADATAKAISEGLPAPVIETSLLVSEKTGRRYSTDYLADQFELVRDAIRADPETAQWGHLVLKHLRHTCITSLAEAGCEDGEISAISGHSQETIKKVIDRYSIRTRKGAASAFKKRVAAEAASDKGE